MFATPLERAIRRHVRARLRSSEVATEHRLGALYHVSLRIAGRARWRMDAFWLVCQMLVACGLVALVFTPMWESLISVVAAFAAWLFEHYYARAFDRGDFDTIR